MNNIFARIVDHTVMAALSAIREEPGITLTALSDRCIPSVRQNVRMLSEYGYISQETKGHAKHLTLSDRGNFLLDMMQTVNAYVEVDAAAVSRRMAEIGGAAVE